MLKLLSLAAMTTGMLLLLTNPARSDDLQFKLRYQTETKAGSGRYHTLARSEAWKPAETALIICDVWDLHHSVNAVRRVEEFAPRLNELIGKARTQGVTIIHAPSDCMPAYAGTPARLRAEQAPKSANAPKDVALWCSRIPAEERAAYPIDQSDGGDDDAPQAHAEWAAKLKQMGRNVGTPWLRQTDLIKIDTTLDYISDRGDEVWNILEQRGIKNVILAGVHTNMCVIGRPFGLRQMVRGGKRVALLRDMTDTMYNPASWPYVSHFTGTDLIISHIERFVCPTLTSDQFLGGKPFRFAGDKRPHVAIVMSEDEYETERTLPEFASRYLGKAFRVSYIFGNETERNDLPGLDAVDDPDVLVVSIRRRVLRPEQMAYFRKYADAGKPIVGIRTASHAFSLRPGVPLPEGFVAWPEFDAQMFGGSYHGHRDNALKSLIRIVPEAGKHPILKGLSREPFTQTGSLYEPLPLAQGTNVLLNGTIEGTQVEPVAWTFQRADGGRSFYTSIGHKVDLQLPTVVQLLVNGISWAAGIEAPSSAGLALPREAYERHWIPIAVPGSLDAGSGGLLKEYRGTAWYRAVVRVPTAWKGEPFVLTLPTTKDQRQIWINGHAVPATESSGLSHYTFDPAWIDAGDANLIVIRLAEQRGAGGLLEAPTLLHGADTLRLQGRWQVRLGDDPKWSNMPLPSKFGTSTDIVFE